MARKSHFLLLSIIALLISGCSSLGNDPKPIATSEKPVDVNVVKVIRSGEFEERVETEVLPQNNCDNKSSLSFSVRRERTLEQSVDLTLKAEGGGELELAGKPMEVGAAGKIIAAVGVEYGQSSGLKIVDSGDMNFNIEAGDFPVYTIVWREKWEKGYIVVQHDGEKIDIPYLYLTTARPELVKVEYNICPTGTTPQIESTSVPFIQPTSEIDFSWVEQEVEILNNSIVTWHECPGEPPSNCAQWNTYEHNNGAFVSIDILRCKQDGTWIDESGREYTGLSIGVHNRVSGMTIRKCP